MDRIKQDMLKIETYYNKTFKYKQIEIYDFDHLIEYVEFYAKIVTNKVMIVPNYVISAVIDLENKEISFTIPIEEVANITK